MTTSRSKLVGETLADDRYQILGPLGSGGMASVFLARDRRLDRDVVIKLPHRHLLDGDPTFERRFLAEMRSLVAVCHPHIVTIIDAGRHDDAPYVVLQYLAGGTLQQSMKRLRLEAADSVPWRQLLQWLPSIAEALDYLHAKGFIHRDVKPANILFDAEQQPYLSDFGLVRVVGESSTHLTRTGVIVGTPTFLAPEARRFLPLDGRADQYALGVTAHYFLFGTPPESSAERAERNARVADRTSAVPRCVVEAIVRAAAEDRADRFRSCSDFVAALKSAWDPAATASIVPNCGAVTGRSPSSEVPNTTPLASQAVHGDVAAPPIPPRRPTVTTENRRILLLAVAAVCGALGFATWLNLPPTQYDLLNRDAASLVGRWRNESGLGMQFFADGRLREERLFDQGEGTYELLPGKKIRIHMQGMFGGLLPSGGEGVLRYELSDQELSLSSESGFVIVLRFRREE